MGKYMKKSRMRTASSELALMDALSPSPLGVRTRARTLAFQLQLQLQQHNLHKTSSPSPSSPPLPAPHGSSAAYLQLRSRKLLLKPIVSAHSKRPKRPVSPVKNPNPNANSGPAEVTQPQTHITPVSCSQGHINHDGVTVEASCGENVLDSESKGRSARESTPCSLFMNPDSIQTPGSATGRPESSMRRHILTVHEMDELFADEEKEQQKQFIEKYNFDPVNDKPLPGRYEWQMLGD